MAGISVARELPDPEWLAEDRGGIIVGISTSFSALCTVCMLLRLYVRIFILHSFQLDDYIIIAACVSCWICVGMGIIAVDCGQGQHMATLTSSQISCAIKWSLLGFIPGIFSFTLPKLAAIILLDRLLPSSSGRHAKLLKRVLWLLGLLCILALIVCIILTVVRCIPLKAFWSSNITNKKCISPIIVENFSIFSGAFSAFVDFCLAAFPLVFICNLKLTLSKKIGISIALGFGFCACAVAIVKTVQLFSLASDDFTFESADILIWTIVEGEGNY